MSGKRLDDIQRKEDHCPIHGRTEFAGYTYTGKAKLQWRCMSCGVDRSREHRARGDAPIHREKAPVPSTLKICPGCHTVLPKTGVCDYC